MKAIASIVIILFVGTIFVSCENSTFFSGTLKERTTYLYLNYWNPDGNSPQITWNKDASSQSVVIDFDKAFGSEVINANTVKISFSNIRIVDAFGNYKIKSIAPEEFTENKWKTRSEFPVEAIGGKSLAIVLALDASKSLGSNFVDVKTYARNFIENVWRNIPSAKIGVIAFSDTTLALPLTTDKTTVISFIDNMKQGTTTSLYKAMNDGATMLQNTDTESRVLVTFTDGNDTEDIFTQQDVVAQLEKVGNGTVKCQSYMIGLKGNELLDKEKLNQLSVRGLAVVPEDKKQLQEFFDYFSRIVSTVYNLNYQRNRAIIAETAKKSIRFKFTVVQE